MSTPVPPSDLGRFRSRILLSMGLAPALALAGCDAAEAPGLVEGSDLVDLLAHQPALREPVASSPTLTLTTDSVEANRLATFRVTGAEPGAVVHFFHGTSVGLACPDSLAGACIDTIDPAVRIGVREADRRGVATLTEPFPDLEDGATILGQVVAIGEANVVTYSEVHEETVLHPARTCADVAEVDRHDPMGDGEVRLVCEGRDRDEACTPADQVTSWVAEDMYARAAGHALDPDWMVSALCLEDSITDDCCYTMRTDWLADDDWVGRPFEVAGQPRRARCETSAAWSELLDVDLGALPERLRERLEGYWSRLGVDEHASVASFSRFNLELVALGAPSRLLAASTRAVADEIRHARLSFGIASVFAGAPVGPGRIPIAGALDRSEDPEAVLVAAILEGCVNETICAAQARAAAEGAADDRLRELLRGIADDESRHAELSWAFVRWMLETRPELRDVAARTFERAYERRSAPAADPDRRALLRFGMTTDDLKHEVAVEVMRQVVRPCAELLLGRVARPAA